MSRRTVAVFLSTCLLVLAACGESSNQYPHDQAEGVYFKVPRSWAVFDITEDLFSDRVAGGATSVPVRVWALDAGPDPSAAHVDDEERDEPVGLVQVLSVSAGLAEAVSISSVRAFGFEFDPVNPQTGLDTTWEVVTDQSLRTEDGISGAVAIFNRRATEDDDWISQAREVFVDPNRQRVYLFDVYCSASCFEQHYDEIFDVINSWRIDL